MANTVYCLQHSFVSVSTEAGLSYGGSQSFSENMTMSRCGCGVVAALDWLLYLQKRAHPDFVSFLPKTQGELKKEDYVQLLQTLSRKYLPLIYPKGINGLVLAGGMNLLFLREHLPYKAIWRVTRKGLWEGIKDMLQRDYPVILSVGPNFPRLLFGKEKAMLYRRDTHGTLSPFAGVNAHYMTVTELEGEWLRLSSWGREYYLNIPSYEEYVREHSSYVFSNILYIEEK